jgi:hypothetical protein
VRVKVPTPVVEALLEKTKSDLRGMGTPVDFEALIGRGILRAERKDKTKALVYPAETRTAEARKQLVKTHAVATVNGKRVEKLRFATQRREQEPCSKSTSNDSYSPCRA